MGRMDPLHLLSQTTPPVPDTTSWFDGTAQIITAVTGLLGAALAWFKHYRPKQRKRAATASFVGGLQEVGQMYETMEDMLQTSDRVIVFAAHNSGGIPRIGSPFYTTAVNWRTKRSHKIPLGEYKEMVVDGVYVNMLVKLRESGELLFVTKDNPHCYLGDIYRSEGISESVLFYLGIRENKFLYLSVAIYDGKHFSETDRTVLRIRASHLRQLVLKTIN